MVETTDPQDERFDVLTAAGAPTGRTKRRADVHAAGDWHRAFHLWLVWRDGAGQPWVLYQQRSAGKDTWPNRLDVAVGGHFRAGEGLEDVVREVEEELGVAPPLDDLVFVTARRSEHETPDFIDREVQEVYAWPLASLPPLRPHPVELAAVVQVALADLERLVAGASSVPALRAAVSPAGLDPWQATTIRVADFIPGEDSYWLEGARQAARCLADGN